MYNTILLPLDLNAKSSWKKALPQAVELIRASRGTLHVMTVVPEMGSPLVEGFFPQDFEEKAVAAASEALNQLVVENVPDDIKVKQHLGFGKIHKKVLAAIGETNADLVMIGAPLPNRVREFLIGSNADRIVSRSPVSVLVVRA
tara:strand:- start:36150 stop:36581 length:432 start_codon:yes stop_codon:yes gene_type:complete